MSKRYRLLKDLPDIEAGEMFEQDPKKQAYVAPNGTWYHNLDVEKNPEWFEEIKEPLPSQPKEFVWTDELVEDILTSLYVNIKNKKDVTVSAPETYIEQFKSSHPSTEPMKEDKERIDPIEIAALIEKYKEVASKLPKYKLAAIEQVLNDDKEDEDEICFGKKYFRENFYTQQQMDEVIDKTAKAAFIVMTGSSCDYDLDRIAKYYNHPDFKSYKQSLTNQK